MASCAPTKACANSARATMPPWFCRASPQGWLRRLGRWLASPRCARRNRSMAILPGASAAAAISRRASLSWRGGTTGRCASCGATPSRWNPFSINWRPAPEEAAMNKLLAVTGKELRLYFGSPMALIFVGVFLVMTLFVFFWVDSFFARGIADARALFEWMPLLLILLAPALSMHQWSREEASGNLQTLLTMPVRLSELVAGKFLAALALVALALGLTLFLPVTVASLGNLDWGPVIGGYLAALLLASSYVAIGLFVSSRTDNQLVALIGTVIICGAFQAVGSPIITDFFGATTGDLLRQFGTGSRFESIERGVIDFRDLAYYLSLTIFFLALNVLSLDSKRWSHGARLRTHRLDARLGAGLLGLNLLALNLLIAPASFARLDLTQQREYSLSDVTINLLAGLNEPLLVRGYFSEDSHPALAPLVPRIQDALREYELLAGGQLQLEFIDPLANPELEREATQVYGIRPTPLQVNERGGVSLVNVYFDVLIVYGDQVATLNFSDLIEISATGGEVRLRNLEYDLTSAIQRAVFGFQSLDAALASLEQPARLTLYYSSATLPPMMQDVSQTMQAVSQELAADHPDKLLFERIDMSSPEAGLSEQELFDRYQIQPVATSFFAEETFYLHLVIEAADEIQVIYPAGALSQVEIRNAIEAALKRSAAGFLKVIGLWTPPANAADQFGQQLPSLQQYAILEDVLRESYEVRQLTLENGEIPASIDVLVLLAPHNLSDLQRYAIDQYLMRGGAVIIAAGQYRLGIDPYSGALLLEENEAGLAEMLAGYGIHIGEGLVMDWQNAPFPQQVQRDLGGMFVTEIVDLAYPFFVDVRTDGLQPESDIVNSLPLLTVPWASPVTIDAALLDATRASTLIWSSEDAWLTAEANPQPDLETYPELGFPVGEELARYPLAVSAAGAFDSYFIDKPSPFAALADESGAAPDGIGLIERSPESAHLVILGSSEFVNDNVYQIASSFGVDRFSSNLQLVANAIDSFTADVSLASIRSRGSVARILPPISASAQNQWALLNYAVALLGLLGIALVWQVQRRSEKPLELPPPEYSPDDSQGGA
ncbi:MAG: ABC transporter permease subunit [Chloroflexi bacterium]|nr:ABC transporter permease subunit [Chloroflexota bacterium]